MSRPGLSPHIGWFDLVLKSPFLLDHGLLEGYHWITPSTLWLFNIAMENDPFIDVFPISTSIYKGFSMAMLNNQMVIKIGITGKLENSGVSPIYFEFPSWFGFPSHVWCLWKSRCPGRKRRQVETFSNWSRRWLPKFIQIIAMGKRRWFGVAIF